MTTLTATATPEGIMTTQEINSMADETGEPQGWGEAQAAHQWRGAEPPKALPHGKPVPPLSGAYPGLAQEVRWLLGWYEGSGRPFLSSRDAARKTGLSNSTVANMTKGDRVSPDNLKKFSDGIGGDFTRLMALSGYVPPSSDPLNTLGVPLPTALFVRTPVSSRPEGVAVPRGAGLDDVLTPSGEIGDRMPEGLRAIEVRTDDLRPAFDPGDILFVREVTAAQEGRRVVAHLPDGRISAMTYHTGGGEAPYLSPLDGSGPAVRDGFRVVALIEYQLKRA